MSKYAHWSNSLRRAFVKDYSIPITVTQDPYFTHQLNFLDGQFQTRKKAKLLEDAIRELGNEDSFHRYIRETREKVVDYVKNKSYYDSLGESTVSITHGDVSDTKHLQKSIFSQDNVGHRFVSVDLASANFQVLKMHFPKLVDDLDSYSAFISQFSKINYFKESKKIRQVIFGNLNPKAQQRLFRHTIHTLLGHLDFGTSWHPVALTSDEIIFKESDKSSDIKEILDITNDLDLKVNVQEFILEKVPMRVARAFVKRFTDDSFDLKCCPGPYTFEVLRYLYDESPHEYDKVFCQDGRICEYKDELF